MLSPSQRPGLRKRAASSVIRDAESLPASRIPDDRAVLPNPGIPGGPGVPGFRTRPFASGTRDAGNGRPERCGHPAPGQGTFSDSTRCADPRRGVRRCSTTACGDRDAGPLHHRGGTRDSGKLWRTIRARNTENRGFRGGKRRDAAPQQDSRHVSWSRTGRDTGHGMPRTARVRRTHPENDRPTPGTAGLRSNRPVHARNNRPSSDERTGSRPATTLRHYAPPPTSKREIGRPRLMCATSRLACHGFFAPPPLAGLPV